MLNHITIMGRLTRDPELRYTQSQVPVASFTVAVERDYAQGGQRETDFIDCVAWRQTGEFVSKYFQKGGMIVVDGRLQSRHWEDRDGNKRVNWEINADRCYFGEAKRESGYTGGSFDSARGARSAQDDTMRGRSAQDDSRAYRPARGAVNVDPPENDGFREYSGYGEGNPFVGSQQTGFFDGPDDDELPF